MSRTLIVAMSLCAGCASTSSSPSNQSAIVGEWQNVSDAGETAILFFDANGQCGLAYVRNGQSVGCLACTYSFNGTSIGITSNGESPSTDPVSISGNILTIQSLDGGSEEQWTRVNDGPSNQCP